MSSEAFGNRLKKMARHYDKWAKRTGVEVYRIYDRDVPGYPLAVDRVKDYVLVQVYKRAMDGVAYGEMVDGAQGIVSESLEVPMERVILKERERQRGRSQYQRVSEESVTFMVEEAGLQFVVNVSDYLDIGLFPDHRITRAMVREKAQGKRFLNLFAYTGSFTVYAAAGGAMETTTVDLSARYIEWARENLAANGLSGVAHTFVVDDVLAWVDKAPRNHYDLVVLDPPTFSNSKSMDEDWDVQRDYVDLVRSVLALIAPGGELIFSTNKKGFKADWSLFDGIVVKDITKATTPLDFQKKPRQVVFQIVKQKG